MEISKQGKLLCSTWVKQCNLLSVGTAGFYEGFLLIEWPLPWPRDVSEIDSLSKVSFMAKKLNIRLQLIFRDHQRARQDKRLACYHKFLNTRTIDSMTGATLEHNRRSGSSYYSGLGLMETYVRHENLAETAQQILSEIARVKEKRENFSFDSSEPAEDRELSTPLSDEQSPKVAFGLSPEQESSWRDALLDRDEVSQSYDGNSVRDVLICTHGKRDRCCGSLGMNLYKELSNSVLFDTVANRRLYRTSHTGGHRFAPTAILLPQGTLWAFLNEEIMGLIVSEDPDCLALKPHFRGSVGLGESELQVVEAELFAEWGNLFPGENGWNLLHSSRAATLDGDCVTFYVVSPLKRKITISAKIAEKRKIPSWNCGDTPGYQENGGDGKDSYAEYEVTDLAIEDVQNLPEGD